MDVDMRTPESASTATGPKQLSNSPPQQQSGDGGDPGPNGNAGSGDGNGNDGGPKGAGPPSSTTSTQNAQGAMSFRR